MQTAAWELAFRYPVELFQILKDDAVKVLHSICQQIWKTQQWPQDCKKAVFIPIPKKGNFKECSKCCTIALISHAIKVMLKILQARLQQYVNRELPDASVVSNSVQPHRWQPTRLPRPWDSPGKNTGVGCHFLLQCMKVKSESEVTQLYLTLSDPMDWSLPGSSAHVILQARTLEWVAISFSNAWKWKVKVKSLSCVRLLATPWIAA